MPDKHHKPIHHLRTGFRQFALAAVCSISLLTGCTPLATVSNVPSTTKPKTMRSASFDQLTYTRIETANGVSLIYTLLPTPKTLMQVSETNPLGPNVAISSAENQTDSPRRTSPASDMLVTNSKLLQPSTNSTNLVNRAQKEQDLGATAAVSSMNKPDLVTPTTFNHYASGKSDLDARSLLVVEALVATIGSRWIVIKGYTDTTGSNVTNRRIALDRALKVKQAFEKFGTPSAQIQVHFCTDCANVRKVDLFVLSEQSALNSSR
jgi:outer membrane protein OmpA-like peptidoglycan-associated protein